MCTRAARTGGITAFGIFYWLEVAGFALFFLFLFLWFVLHVTFHLFCLLLLRMASAAAGRPEHSIRYC